MTRRGTEAMDEPPRRPRRETLDELAFVRRDAVRWLSPSQLLSMARSVAFAQLIESYADKREVEAVFPQDDVFDHSAGDELWLDFVADLGDGFDATYTVARTLAQRRLDLALPDGTPIRTEQGGVLVMGGDEVYPVASLRGYQDKTVGPYRAAMPYRASGQPYLYALPGNHDWYDGLTSFMRVFGQSGWVGGWRTQQQRSYFALRLPHDWWLLAIDAQFDTYLDAPQMRYFLDVVAPRLGVGDDVILCVARPTWVDATIGDSEAYATVDFFVRTVLEPTGARVRLMLTGDRHHYAHYAHLGTDRHLLTAGGGGAFLSGSHQLPARIDVPPEASHDPGKSPPETYRLVSSFPDRDASRRLKWGVFLLGLRNGLFPVVPGAVGALFAWVAGGRLGPRTTYGDLLVALGHVPVGALAALALAWALIGFTRLKTGKGKAVGVVHAAVHLAAVAAVVGVASWTAGRLVGFDSRWFGVWTRVGAFAGYAVAGCLVLSAYLWVADLVGLNRNELFAAMRNDDLKCFLRLHVGADGSCTVHAVKVKRVGRGWRLRPDGDPEAPWFDADEPPSAPTLIEDPLVLAGTRRPDVVFRP